MSLQSTENTKTLTQNMTRTSNESYGKDEEGAANESPEPTADASIASEFPLLKAKRKEIDEELLLEYSELLSCEDFILRRLAQINLIKKENEDLSKHLVKINGKRIPISLVSNNELRAKVCKLITSDQGVDISLIEELTRRGLFHSGMDLSDICDN